MYVPEPVEQARWANFDYFNSAFSTDISFPSKPCNKVKGELPEVPIVNENISLPDSDAGNNLKKSENQENIIKADDIANQRLKKLTYLVYQNQIVYKIL